MGGGRNAPRALHVNREEKGSSAPRADLWGCPPQRSARGRGERRDVASGEGGKPSSLMEPK